MPGKGGEINLAGCKVMAGGSVGVLEPLDSLQFAEIDIEATEEKKEKEDDEENKALAKAERMEAMKRRAQELIDRRNAAKK